MADWGPVGKCCFLVTQHAMRFIDTDHPVSQTGAMVKSPQQRRNGAEASRRMILDEAIRTISERGYLGLRIQDLAQRCGLTNGGLLYHFASKEALLLAVLDERDSREMIAVREATGFTAARSSDSPLTLQEVKDVVRAIVSRSAEQPEIVRLLHVLSVEALHEAHPAYRYFVNRETYVISTFADMVRPFTDKPESLARRILALAGGLEIQWLRSGCGFDLAAEWDRAVTALFAGCKGSLRVGEFIDD